MAEALAYLTVLVTLPVCWFVVWLLRRAARQDPDLPHLRERYIVALAVAIIVSVFGPIFLNNDAAIPPLSLADTKVITRATVAIVPLVSALVFLRLWLRGNGSH